MRGALCAQLLRAAAAHPACRALAAAVANDGAVFTWGSGSFGRLGHGGEEDVAAPQAVDALMQHVVVMVRTDRRAGGAARGSCGWAQAQVACGAFHTMFLTKLGALFTCGGGTMPPPPPSPLPPSPNHAHALGGRHALVQGNTGSWDTATL